jgi:NitT/TauT family transport system substrate-binding protein
MSKRTITCAVLVAAFAVASVSVATAQGLRMSSSDWPVWETARGMEALKQLDGFSFSYEKYTTTIHGFEEDHYDITFMTLYDFIATQRTNRNGVIIAATDYSSGGDGVVLRSAVGSAAQLKGRTLALQTDSISLYLAHLYLAKAGLSLNDVAISNVKGEFVGKAFSANPSLAGIVGWNPNLAEALAAGGHMVATSADFPATIFDVVVVKRDSLERHRGAFLEFLRKWFAAVKSPEVFAKVAALLGVSASEYRGYLNDAHIYSDPPSSLAAFARMRKVATEIQAFYSVTPSSLEGKAAEHFGRRSLDVDALFDDSLLREASK